MCVHSEWQGMFGRPEHPVCLCNGIYSSLWQEHIVIVCNGRLSYSHVIWRKKKKGNLSFCSSGPLKAVKNKIWFMWSPWDTRCAFSDKQEQVRPPLGFCSPLCLLDSRVAGFASILASCIAPAGFQHRADAGSSQQNCRANWDNELSCCFQESISFPLWKALETCSFVWASGLNSDLCIRILPAAPALFQGADAQEFTKQSFP